MAVPAAAAGGGLMQGLDAASPIITAGMGMMNAKWSDNRQYHQQKKLMREQVKNAKDLGDYNNKLALEMWNATNYEAQLQHMKDAGLSVGMMYEGAGPGGTTHGGQVAMPTSGQAENHADTIGMAMQLGLQSAMQQAQIKLAEAQAKKAEAEANKIGGVDTAAAQTSIDKMKQETDNAKVQNSILNYEKAIKEAEANNAKETQETTVANLKQANAKLIEEVKQASTNNMISRVTAGNIIQQAMQNTIEQSLRMELTRQNVLGAEASTQETFAKISKVAAEIARMKAQTAQGQGELSQEDAKIILQKIQTEFGTGNEAEIMRWINGLVGPLGGAIIKKQ